MRPWWPPANLTGLPLCSTLPAPTPVPRTALQTYHVGYVRDDDTLEASCYLNKLPPSFSSDDLILISDPMLATGEAGMRWERAVARIGLPSLRPCHCAVLP